MKSKLFIFFTWVPFLLGAQNSNIPFQIRLEPMLDEVVPGIQSYAWARDGADNLLIGGRLDGLHKRRPFEAFDASGNNTQLMVYNPSQNKLWTLPLNRLGGSLEEQLQSTNMQFYQKGNDLIVSGGYAFSASAADHITFPYLTHIRVKECIEAIKRDLTPDSVTIRQIKDERFRVTGGYMGMLNDVYYLAGGQNFEGRYNPRGPDFGPGFKQVYTDAIRKFRVDFSDGIQVIDFEEWKSAQDLHRRDYNMLPQIFPDGSKGLTMFSGVFQLTADLPWLNVVDVFQDSFKVNNSVNQLLNQYHTAHLPVYDASSKTMHSVFFGGIAQYYYDEQNKLVKDDNVPFVRTISALSRNASGAQEGVLDTQMPALLGAGAEFIPDPLSIFDERGILMLKEVEANKEIGVGYIIGGIKSEVPNGFFDNTDRSIASPTVYRVYMSKTVSHIKTLSGDQVLDVQLQPNPASDLVAIKYRIQVNEPMHVSIWQADGKLVYNALIQQPEQTGIYELKIPVSEWSTGLYLLRLKGAAYESTSKFMVAR